MNVSLPDPASLPSVEPTLLPAVGSLAAAETLEQRLAAHPEDAQAWFELGCALNRRGRASEALRALDSCLTLAPFQPAALCERGLAQLSLNRLDDAAETFEEVLAGQPLEGLAIFSLGSVRYRQRRFEEATAMWRQAALILDDPVDALENVAVALQHLQRPDEERAVWLQLLDRQPDHPSAIHKLASLGVGAVPERAADAYVTRLFDAFAPEFETVLSALQYAGPGLLAELAEEVLGPPAGRLRVLDAGCGTGLCGEQFRPWARELVGVDLSGEMLARARKRKIYDRLHQIELTTVGRVEPERFSLVIAGDVLNYFGDLEKVFAALLGRLRDEGYLLFTLEKSAEHSASSGYQLEAHGRYGHRPEYVHGCLEQAGACVAVAREATLRYELGRPVTSLVMAVRLCRGSSAGNA